MGTNHATAEPPLGLLLKGLFSNQDLFDFSVGFSGRLEQKIGGKITKRWILRVMFSWWRSNCPLLDCLVEKSVVALFVRRFPFPEDVGEVWNTSPLITTLISRTTPPPPPVYVIHNVTWRKILSKSTHCGVIIRPSLFCSTTKWSAKAVGDNGWSRTPRVPVLSE